MGTKNYPTDSTINLIGKLVQVWVPEYKPEESASKNGKYHWQHVACYHGMVGTVTECDEDDPTWGMAAFKTTFDDGDSVWCWRRELRPAPKPRRQIRLL